MRFDLDKTAAILRIVQSVVTILALVAGGIWAYWTFTPERTGRPKLNASLTVESRPIDTGNSWVVTQLFIENTGKSKIDLRGGFVRVQQVLPLIPEFRKVIETAHRGAYESLSRNGHSVSWPQLCARMLEPRGFVEPGEKASFINEFLIPGSVRVIRVYAFIGTHRSGDVLEQSGWEGASVHELSGAGKPAADGGPPPGDGANLCF
jgi:hypothetical protein